MLSLFTYGLTLGVATAPADAKEGAKRTIYKNSHHRSKFPDPAIEPQGFLTWLTAVAAFARGKPFTRGKP